MVTRFKLFDTNVGVYHFIHVSYLCFGSAGPARVFLLALTYSEKFFIFVNKIILYSLFCLCHVISTWLCCFQCILCFYSIIFKQKRLLSAAGEQTQHGQKSGIKKF